MKTKLSIILLMVAVTTLASTELSLDNFHIGDTESNALSIIEQTNKITPVTCAISDEIKIMTFNVFTDFRNLAIVSVGVNKGKVIALSRVVIVDRKGHKKEFLKIKNREIKDAEKWYEQQTKSDTDLVILESKDFTLSSGYILQACGTKEGLDRMVGQNK